MPSPGLQKPCKVSCWHLDTSLAAAWQQRLCLLCLCLGQSQTRNRWLTPTVWRGHPQSSPGLPWPALPAWDGDSCPCPLHPPYPCRGRQWNTAPSWRVPCHLKWLQLQGHGSWRRPVAPIISTTISDGLDALTAFIWEIAISTISVVIGMGGPSNGVCQTGGLGSSWTECWDAFGSALTRPSAWSLHSLMSSLHHSLLVCQL